MRPIALTIAGSDSGGGAGIQADLKTFHQFGVYGTTAVVALTAQNTLGVRAASPVPETMIDAQLAAVAEDLPPAAVKTGMLATDAIVRQVSAAISRYGWRRYVCDPVMVATSGDRLLDESAIHEVRARLVPLALLVTPNLEEAAILSGLPTDTPEGMEAAASALVELGARAALVKGGHMDAAELVDVLVTRATVRRFGHPRIDTRSTHGTGCTLSAAITAGLALAPGGDVSDQVLEQAVSVALDFVHRAIRAAPGLGQGHGPLSHWVTART